MPLDLVLEDGEKKEIKTERLDEEDVLDVPKSTNSPPVVSLIFLYIPGCNISVYKISRREY